MEWTSSLKSRGDFFFRGLTGCPLLSLACSLRLYGCRREEEAGTQPTSSVSVCWLEQPYPLKMTDKGVLFFFSGFAFLLGSLLLKRKCQFFVLKNRCSSLQWLRCSGVHQAQTMSWPSTVPSSLQSPLSNSPGHRGWVWALWFLCLLTLVSP